MSGQLSRNEKASVILDCIISQSRYYPQVYHEFVGVLQKEGSFTDSILKTLTDCYESQQRLQKQIVYIQPQVSIKMYHLYSLNRLSALQDDPTMQRTSNTPTTNTGIAWNIKLIYIAAQYT